VVWHHSLPLMNSFNKTEAAVFSCRLCFLRAFPFIILYKEQWTASVANFVRMSLNSFKENYFLCNDRQRQECLFRHDVVRVFVSFLVLVFVRAILSWCP